MPLLRNADKSKISKRKNPAARLTWFLEQGYLPEALRNFLGLMGYSLPDGRGGLHLRRDVGRRFDWARVNAVGPVFDLDKLGWLNGHYIRAMPTDELAERHRRLSRCCRRADARRHPAGDAARAGAHGGAARGAGDARVPARRAGRDRPGRGGEAAGSRSSCRWWLRRARRSTRSASGRRTRSRPHCARRWSTGMGLKPKHAFGPVRVAVTGRTVSPPLFESLELLGRDRTLARLAAASDGGRSG